MLKERVPLSKHSNYKIGGPSRYFFEAEDVRSLEAALRRAKEEKLKVFVLGGGTNLLISDKGFDGLVIKPRIRFLKAKGTDIEAGAGALMSDLLEFAAKKKLSGLEWAGGLPGTVGGAIRGNAGCFGGEVKDVVRSVTSLRLDTMKEQVRSNKACRFGYRASVFKEKGDEIILSAVFRLKKGNEKEIRAKMQEKIDYRHARHPMDYPNIGSIFKNVPLENIPKRLRKSVAHAVKNDPFPVVPVAYLLSILNLKGRTSGGAMVSHKHPNFIVNAKKATAKDVERLIRTVKAAVKRKFGIELEEEVMKI